MKVYEALLEQTEEQKIAVVYANDNTTLILKTDMMRRPEELKQLEDMYKQKTGLNVVMLNGDITPVSITIGNDIAMG